MSAVRFHPKPPPRRNTAQFTGFRINAKTTPYTQVAPLPQKKLRLFFGSPNGGSRGSPERGVAECPKGHELAGVAQLAEQLICNQQVAGSIPVTSSKQFHIMGRFQSGQMDQTVNLTSTTSVVRIHLFPPPNGTR